MWLTFAIAVVMCVLAFYLPGFLLFLGLGVSRIRALLIAPLASVAGYCLLGIILPKFGVFCSWMTVFLPMLVICAIPFLIRLARGRKDGLQLERTGILDWRTLGVYVTLGLAIGVYVYVMPLGAPDAFSQEYDNAFHMETIRAFVDSGTWSVLEVSKYMTPVDQAIAPLPGAGFYPALWHLMCALVVNVLGCPVALALNAVNYVVASLVFSTGMMLLLATVFADCTTVRLGSLVTLAFVGFPWVILYWGPLYANAFGFALVPPVAALFVRIVGALGAHALKVVDVFAFLLGTLVLAVAQTSSIFFCVIFLAPYCVYRLWTHEGGVHLGRHVVSQRLLAVLFALFVLGVWTGLVFAPFMHSLVFNNEWVPLKSVGQGVWDVITLAFGWFAPQYVLAALVLVGIACSVRHREHLWITVAYLIFCVIYVICVANGGFARHFFAGFWYADSYRIVACLALVGIPLAALGLAYVVRFLRARVRLGEKGGRLCLGILLTLLCVVLYLPTVEFGGFKMDTALGQVQKEYFGANHNEIPSHHIKLDADEEVFLAQVAEVVPEGELILNMPDDGSVFAYATNGLRTYYRDYRFYDGSRASRHGPRPPETRESKTIRKYGAWFEGNEMVHDALEEVGARYVLILDQGKSFRGQPKPNSYDDALWTGLMAITDDTPGFEVVLSEGDMRLYRILGIEEG